MELLGLVATGVVIFILGQYVLRLIVEPAADARKAMAKARLTFSYYADIWANPMRGDTGNAEFLEAQRKASGELRRTAGELQVIPSSVVGYRMARLLFALPRSKNLTDAARNFMGLSNALFGSGGSEYAQDFVNRYSDEIKAALGWD